MKSEIVTRWTSSVIYKLMTYILHTGRTVTFTSPGCLTVDCEHKRTQVPPSYHHSLHVPAPRYLSRPPSVAPLRFNEVCSCVISL
ncbi:hypothetical protein JOB18_025169 [Solea senegalensis]|uniref:Uncharacterized protein n=1 Tax=Solea senegalensis TaxID=28829 RepID=A0AAV6Q7R3_SOLSE|nr:hypothetical protein JOB18_025169 [Solea senegalensis]